jgi:hypothetical protein
VRDLFTQTQPQPMASDARRIVPCDRCGISLQYRERPSNPDARIMRHAQQPKGFCATCGFRSWLASDYGGHLEEIIRRDCAGGAGALKMPHIQECIKTAIRVGQCEAPFEEIDFDRLVSEWDLPVAGVSSRGKRKRS